MNTLEAQQLAEKLRELDFFSQQSEKLDAEFEKLVDFVESSESYEQLDQRFTAIIKAWPQFNY